MEKGSFPATLTAKTVAKIYIKATQKNEESIRIRWMGNLSIHGFFVVKYKLKGFESPVTDATRTNRFSINYVSISEFEHSDTRRTTTFRV